MRTAGTPGTVDTREVTLAQHLLGKSAPDLPQNRNAPVMTLHTQHALSSHNVLRLTRTS